MKTPYYLVLGALLLVGIPASAQITFTASDAAAQLAVGRTMTNNSDTTTTSLNIGSTGATSWNFTGLLAHTSSTLTSVSLASSPFAADFPGATHAIQAPVTYAGIPVTGYQYLTLGTSLLNPGQEANASLGPLGTANLKITESPLDVVYALPSTYGTAWSSIYTETTAITINGFPQTPSSTSHNISYTVDAYGVMTLPGGISSNALRIRRVEHLNGGSLSYIFLANNGGLVRVTASDTLQPSSGVISIARKSISWTPGDPALPIQLASFTGVTTDAHVTLHWMTVSEQANYGFDVERRSDGVAAWTKVGFVEGNGTTIEKHTYGFNDQPATPGKYFYRLKQIDVGGGGSYSEPVAVTVNVAGAITAPEVPVVTALMQNYPNPFNPSTRVGYALAHAGHVRLNLFNALGQPVATLVDADQSAGFQNVQFDATRLSSGVYFYRLEADGLVQTRRMMLVR
jgi:hypothetical protein